MFKRFSTWWFRRKHNLATSPWGAPLLSAESRLCDACNVFAAPKIVAIGVLSSWESEFSSMLYNFNVAVRSSFFWLYSNLISPNAMG